MGGNAEGPSWACDVWRCVKRQFAAAAAAAAEFSDLCGGRPSRQQGEDLLPFDVVLFQGPPFDLGCVFPLPI